MDFFNPQKFLLGGIKKEIVDAMHDTPTYFTYLASTSSKPTCTHVTPSVDTMKRLDGFKYIVCKIFISLKHEHFKR